MKKYFLCIAVLLWGLVDFGTQPVWGQAEDYSSKFWSSTVSALEKDPEKGRKTFEKRFGEILQAWTNEPAQIAVMKDGLKKALERLGNAGSPGFTVASEVMFEQLKPIAQEKARNTTSAKTLRFNAILTIGELNSSQKKGERIVPYAKARPLLKELLKENDPAIQILALKGLARHVECGVSGEERNELVQIFGQLAFAPLPKGDSIGTPESQWMRLISIEALGNIGIAGPKGEISGKLLEMAAKQNMTIENPYFRRDMERRIAAAKAFAKLKLDADGLKAIGKKPADVTNIMSKLFLQCMIYEYDFDYELVGSMETGQVQPDEMVGNGRQKLARSMQPEEEAYQIRLWKQRTKAISATFAWIFTDKNSNLNQMEKGNPKYSKIARKIRDISGMYDRAGIPKAKRSTQTENPEDPGMAPMESSIPEMQGKISLYRMQSDLRRELTELAEEMEIQVTIKKKPRPQNEGGY